MLGRTIAKDGVHLNAGLHEHHAAGFTYGCFAGVKLDLHELDTSYTVKAEIPGVRKEDIDVRVDGNTVTISAEVKKEKEEKKEGRVLRRERQEGYASRSFTLACPVNEAEAEAKYENGVLSLTLPKKAAGSKKRLSVQ